MVDKSATTADESGFPSKPKKRLAHTKLPREPCCNSCACDEAKQEPSRLSDAFRVVVTWTAPLLRRPVFDLCSGGAPPCLLCPDTCVLPLAMVLLPARNQPISAGAIDNASLRGQ